MLAHLQETPGFSRKCSGTKVLVLDEADRLLEYIQIYIYVYIFRDIYIYIYICICLYVYLYIGY
jgi:hypothetical protein